MPEDYSEDALLEMAERLRPYLTPGTLTILDHMDTWDKEYVRKRWQWASNSPRAFLGAITPARADWAGSISLPDTWDPAELRRLQVSRL